MILAIKALTKISFNAMNNKNRFFNLVRKFAEIKKNLSEIFT